MAVTGLRRLARLAAPGGGMDHAPHKLAVLGRVTGLVLLTLALLAGLSGGLALLAEASGMAHGRPSEALYLIGCALVCAALAAVALGLSRFARKADALAREELALLTLHKRDGALFQVEHAGDEAAGDLLARHRGIAFLERVLVTDRPAFLAALSSALSSGRPVTCEVRLATGMDAEAAPVFTLLEARAAPAGRGLARVAWRARDVLEKRALAESALAEAEARAEAERANQEKTRFLAAMSHELRTPLNAIIGFSELLATDAGAGLDPARKADYARIIHESGQHLLGLVNDILDLSRVEAGAYDLAIAPIDVRALLEGCREMVALEAEKAGVALLFAVPHRLPHLEADRRAVKQMVINLVANAVKFTPQGGAVEVSVRARRGRLAIKVSDTGPGMSQEEVARLGEPFFQAGDAARKAKGSGLGLAVVKGLVTLHHGAFEVESAPGLGTTVTLTLPCRAQEAARERAARAQAVPEAGTGVAPFPRAVDGAAPHGMNESGTRRAGGTRRRA